MATVWKASTGDRPSSHCKPWQLDFRVVRQSIVIHARVFFLLSEHFIKHYINSESKGHKYHKQFQFFIQKINRNN